MGEVSSILQAKFPRWARGPARIVGDEIVLDEDRAEMYHLGEAMYVEFALEDLDEHYPQSAVAFARKYGLLWHGAEYLGTGECRERISDWWNVAYELHFVLTLYRGIQESLRAGTAEPLENLGEGWTAIDWSRLTVGSKTWRSLSEETLDKEPNTGEEYTDERFLADVCQVLAAFINVGLENCETGFLALTRRDEGHSQLGKFALQIAPQNLVGAAYASYASVIAQRREIKECPGCGRMFFPESGRQKYCTKSCASTSRWHRWKERQDTE
jgi:hypothetical protein